MILKRALELIATNALDTLYLTYESEERNKLLENFGKHTKSKACIYVNKLAYIDTNVLKDLITHTVKAYQCLYPSEVPQSTLSRVKKVI